MGNGIWGNETVSAILGGISGGVVSWLVARHASHEDRAFSSYQTVETVLDDLECASRAYWRQAGQIPGEESTIKNLLERLDLKIQAHFRIIKKEELEHELNIMIDDLTDLVSGGDFETVKRKPSFGRVQRIKNQCLNIRNILHK